MMTRLYFYLHDMFSELLGTEFGTALLEAALLERAPATRGARTIRLA